MKPKHLPRLWCALLGVLPLGAERADPGRRNGSAALPGAGTPPGRLTLPRLPHRGTVRHGIG